MDNEDRYYSNREQLAEDRLVQLYNIEGMRELSYMEYMEREELEKELIELSK